MLDVVVVGLGGVGSFALRALSKKLAQGKILGIDRFRKCHDRGSSHGASRIYRKAYFEHPHYVPWIQYSEQVFRSLPEGVVENCGTLVMEEESDSVGGVIKACQESARLHGIPTENLSNADLQERYPMFRLASKDTIGLLEPGGGFVRPELAMAAALGEAETNGAQVMEEIVVDSLKEMDNNHIEIHIAAKDNNDTPGMMIQAKRVIVASGAWTSSLVPSFASKLQVTRQLQAWIDVQDDDDEAYLPSKMPTWYMSTPRFPLSLYGIPRDPCSVKNPGWTKIGIHCRDVPINPSYASPHVNSVERQELMEAAEASLTGKQKHKIALAKPCLYTMSPDEHFIVGRPALSSRNIVVAAGLSGHGFKMTPALGAMVVDMALDDDDAGRWNAEFLSPARFGI